MMKPFAYTEYTVQAVSSVRDVNWHLRHNCLPAPSPPPPRDHHGDYDDTNTSPKKGPTSLFQTAIKVAAQNLGRVDGSVLDQIPRPWLRRMCQYLDDNPRFISFSAWKHLVAIFHQDGNPVPCSLVRVRNRNRDPTADLPVYINPLRAAAPLKFLCHLRISGSCPFKAADLMLLPGLATLAVLEMDEPADAAQPFPRVTDRLVRAWSQQQAQPFPNLVILKLCTLHSLTDESLCYVTDFPRLAMFEVRAATTDWRGARKRAKQLGWFHCDWADALDHERPHRDGVEACLDARSRTTWLLLTRFVGAWGRRGYCFPEQEHDDCAHWLSSRLLDDGRRRRACFEAARDYYYSSGDAPRPSMMTSSFAEENPLALLSLGRDERTVGTTSRVWRGTDRVFFWRTWVVSEDCDEARHHNASAQPLSPPRRIRIPRPEAPPQEPEPKQKPRRPLKRKRKGVDDMLREFLK